MGIANERVTPSTEIVIFNAAGKVLAYPDVNGITRLIEDAEGTTFFEQVNVSDLNNPVLDALYTRYLSGVRHGALNFSADNRVWMGSLSHIACTRRGRCLSRHSVASGRAAYQYR